MRSVPHSPPPVPDMPTLADKARADMQRVRYKILRDDFDTEAVEWLKVGLHEDVVDTLGPSDISCNTLADASRQLSTPGLYGHRPKVGLPQRELVTTVTLPDGTESEERTYTPDPLAEQLAGVGGYLDNCGYWTQGRYRQFLAQGMADWVVRPDLDAAGELIVRMVKPHHVVAWDDASAPGVAVKVWELRLRYWVAKKSWVWTWDALCLSDPDHGGQPSYRILLGQPKNGEYVDVSNVFLDRGDVIADRDGERFGALVGEDYPYVSAKGQPVLPYVWFTPLDTGELWHHLERRAVTRGALNAVGFHTLANHAAKVTACEPVIALDVDEPPADIQVDDEGKARPIKTKVITAGAMWFLSSRQGAANASVKPLGTGKNLEILSDFAIGYELRQFIRWGLNPDDVTRRAANPTSGAALAISNKGKREFAAIVEPMFRRSDLEVIRISAIVLNSRPDKPKIPETGYSISYYQIPSSPEEQAEQREQETWDLEHDQTSLVDVYMKRHPGTTEEDAIRAIVRSRVHKARIEERVRAALAQEGLDGATPAAGGSTGAVPPATPKPPAQPAGEET